MFSIGFFSGVVFLVFVLIQNGNCLECYHCSSKYQEECLKPEKYNVARRRCDMSALNETKHLARSIDESFERIFHVDDIKLHEPQIPTNCLKQVIKVGTKNIIIRGCQLAPSESLNICEKVKKMENENVRTTHCSLCGRDGCNVAGKMTSFEFMAPVFVLTSFLYQIL